MLRIADKRIYDFTCSTAQSSTISCVNNRIVNENQREAEFLAIEISALLQNQYGNCHNKPGPSRSPPSLLMSISVWNSYNISETGLQGFEFQGF